MRLRTFVVTGGNAGIGKAIAVALARQEHQVVIISRNGVRGASALAEIRELSGNPSTDLVVGDLACIESTRRLAACLLERYPGISVLINNAGIWPTRKAINADGLESAFMVNHLAPYILSRMLLPRLRENAPARIVNVNAGLYVKGKLDLHRTPQGDDFSALGTYANTKLCNVYQTQQLALDVEGSGVTVNAVHPGVIRTGLGDRKGFSGWLLRQVKRTWGAPEEGAKPPVRLATAADVEGTNGRYFMLMDEQPYAPNAQDRGLREGLWDLSRKLASV